MDRDRLALQLYSVRALTAEDFPGTLRAVAALGYGAVEFAGFFGISGGELCDVMATTGLIGASSHVALETLERDTDATLQWHADLGIRDLVIPWLAPELRSDAAAWRSVAARIGKIGTRVNEAGFRLAYHHHDFEFHRYAGTTGLEILMDACDPACVGLQVDTYWARYGGTDPAGLINRYADRLASLHLKDMDGTRERGMAEVGTGILDFESILAAAERSTARWLIVEHDHPPSPPLDSVRLSLENLRALLARQPRQSMDGRDAG
ncbi:MAG: sugar phosphate isomerase/epimerase [Candidatus Sumerlaeaceae bacterium]|nr:sugar phosphate isomerase/epimerase [Candidatus Sumerlaeaceae bacterium]